MLPRGAASGDARKSAKWAAWPERRRAGASGTTPTSAAACAAASSLAAYPPASSSSAGAASARSSCRCSISPSPRFRPAKPLRERLDFFDPSAASGHEPRALPAPSEPGARLMKASRLILPTLAAALFAAAPLAAAPADDEQMAGDDRVSELERKVELLTDELARTKQDIGVPEEKPLESVHGLGPGASKIYNLTRGLSIGGYAEGGYTAVVHDKRKSGDTNGADFTRAVLYAGYKFTDRILFNSEIEFEHGSTEENGSGVGRVRHARLPDPGRGEHARGARADADGLPERDSRAAVLLRNPPPRRGAHDHSEHVARGRRRTVRADRGPDRVQGLCGGELGRDRLRRPAASAVGASRAASRSPRISPSSGGSTGSRFPSS